MMHDYPIPEKWEPYINAGVVDLITIGANHSFRYTLTSGGSGIAAGIGYCKTYVELFANKDHWEWFVKDGDKISNGDKIVSINGVWNEDCQALGVVVGMLTAFISIANGVNPPSLGNIARKGRAIGKYLGNRPMVFNANHCWDFIANVYIANALKAGFGGETLFTTALDNALITRDKQSPFRSISMGFINNCYDKWDWKLYDKLVAEYKSKNYPVIPEFDDYRRYRDHDNVFDSCDGILLFGWSINDLKDFRAKYPNKKIYIGYFNDQAKLRKLFVHEFATKTILYDGLVVTELFKTFELKYV
jgi:hypothetical protein